MCYVLYIAHVINTKKAIISCFTLIRTVIKTKTIKHTSDLYWEDGENMCFKLITNRTDRRNDIMIKSN